jgi:xeroderma pigmentosum group C-complementing protein
VRERNRAFLDALEDDQSSLSSASSSDSDDFEDVLPTSPPKRQKTAHKTSQKQHEDSDDDLEFEDVAETAEDELVIPNITENFEVTIRAPGEGEPTRLTLKQGGKAAITKKMRRARVLAHCMHVQFLLWHNVIRNAWCNDKEVQGILVKGLPEALREEVKRWRVAVGLERPKKSKKGPKGKVKLKEGRERIRDWGADAEKSEQHTQGDPLIRLLKYLASYWKKRFVVTAPSLRKLGYRPPREMRQEMDSWNDGPHDPQRHGERVEDLEDFRECAKRCQGSRDVGAQLFTALLRGLGIEARMVASLQPTGFGWSKIEEAHPRKDASTATTDAAATASDEPRAIPRKAKTIPKKTPTSTKEGTSNRPVNLISDASDLSSSLSSDEAMELVTSNTTPSSRPQKRFDTDLPCPTYWTEVLTPTSNNYIPLSTLIPPYVHTTPEHLDKFEPRGAAAEKSKQVMAYVVTFSADGTAKDVTVRYLKKRQWPGRTKGFRMPVEKIPLYNSNGKILRYEEYDWFKRVMRCYARPSPKRTLADDVEDEGDLIPVLPSTEDLDKKKTDPDSLQAYKASPDFVLERHLRREEALLPGARPVKHFHVGKGEKATKEPVYKRSDVVLAKSVETWHKEGRQLRPGEQALKQVAYRAVTLLRKREIEDQARDMDGVKPTQGLYAEYQTEWIIPNPIGPAREIPRNSFGNIDVYVPSMVPRGAIHIPLKGTARVCKKLDISFAEACTGFEFGKQRAVPVITGVVVAEENEELVIDAWREDERIRQEREGKKREEKSLKLWKVFLRGMLVRERIGREYGFKDGDEEGEEVGEWARRDAFSAVKNGGHAEGGFVRDGEDGDDGGGFLAEDGLHERSPRFDSGVQSGGFLAASDDEEAEAGGFEIVGGSQDPRKKKNRAHSLANGDGHHLPTPISLQAMHARPTGTEDEGLSGAGHDSDTSMPELVERVKTTTTKGKQKAMARVNAGSEDDEDLTDIELSEDFKPNASKKSKKAKPTLPDTLSSNDDESDAFEIKPLKKGEGKKVRKETPRKPRRAARKAAPVSSRYFSH